MIREDKDLQQGRTEMGKEGRKEKDLKDFISSSPPLLLRDPLHFLQGSDPPLTSCFPLPS